jgi:hypothetical protein
MTPLHRQTRLFILALPTARDIVVSTYTQSCVGQCDNNIGFYNKIEFSCQEILPCFLLGQSDRLLVPGHRCLKLSFDAETWWRSLLHVPVLNIWAVSDCHSDLCPLKYMMQAEIWICKLLYCRSQWPCGPRRRSTVARLLRSWVRIQLGAWMFFCCVFCVLSGRGLCDELITRPRGVLPTVARRCVWSRNLVDEEAISRAGLQSQRK